MTAAESALRQLPTPAAVVELDRFERNCERMRDRAAGLGVRLRPHVKTHKSVAAARRQLGGETGPVTVSTLAEAAGFAAAGFDDLTYAVPAGPAKLDDLAAIRRRLRRLRLVVDHHRAVEAAAAAAERHGLSFEILLEVDCGDHRSGIDPGSDAALQLAHAVRCAGGLSLAGILTHAGQSYRARNRRDAAATAVTERRSMVELAERLRGAGFPVEEVSIGSTPTVLAATGLGGVTEIRPGNYVFFDCFQAAIESCEPDDVALSVVCEVIAVHPARRRLVVDAGALALSVDPGPRHVDADCGYGVVCDLGLRPVRGLRLTKLSQEHGVVAADAPATAAAFAPGDRLRILPNHSCLTVACHEVLHVARGGAIVETWRPLRGWAGG